MSSEDVSSNKCIDTGSPSSTTTIPMASVDLSNQIIGANNDTADMPVPTQPADSTQVDEEPQFRRFSELPPEIKNMIFEAAVDYNPAIIYANIRVEGQGPHAKAKISRGSHSERSEFRQIIRLAEAFPDFKKFIEHKFGVDFRSAVRCPSLAVRGSKDLLVFTLQQSLAVWPSCWLQYARQSKRLWRSHGIHAPNIRNVAIRYDQQTLHGLKCRLQCWPVLTNSLNGHLDLKCCPFELASFAKNFSHLENVFVLVLLRTSHFGPKLNTQQVKQFIHCREIDARRRGLAVFIDQKRTWVEVKDSRSISDRLIPSLSDIFRILKKTREAFVTKDCRIKLGAYPRDKVGFRLLVSSHSME